MATLNRDMLGVELGLDRVRLIEVQGLAALRPLIKLRRNLPKQLWGEANHTILWRTMLSPAQRNLPVMLKTQSV